MGLFFDNDVVCDFYKLLINKTTITTPIHREILALVSWGIVLVYERVFGQWIFTRYEHPEDVIVVLQNEIIYSYGIAAPNCRHYEDTKKRFEKMTLQ